MDDSNNRTQNAPFIMAKRAGCTPALAWARPGEPRLLGEGDRRGGGGGGLPLRRTAGPPGPTGMLFGLPSAPRLRLPFPPRLFLRPPLFLRPGGVGLRASIAKRAGCMAGPCGGGPRGGEPCLPRGDLDGRRAIGGGVLPLGGGGVLDLPRGGGRGSNLPPRVCGERM